MNYEIITARRRLNSGAYDVTIRATPQKLRDYFRNPGERQYHVHQNQWYLHPNLQRCPPDLESRLIPLYERIQHLAQEQKENPPT